MSLNHFRSYGSAAEAIQSTDTEDDCSGSEEVQELLDQLVIEEKKKPKLLEKNKNKNNSYKHKMLRKRQIKIETEAWEEAAKEYQELLEDMREQKLAPNLPYMKSLFLGWFEPLKNAIAADQELCKDIRTRLSHSPYFNELPPDMMAVITMHKLMGLLMTNSNGIGSARVIQAACQIGEAIEHEVYFVFLCMNRLLQLNYIHLLFYTFMFNVIVLCIYIIYVFPLSICFS
jgi:DNA-directed RNA polymerase